MIEAGVHINAIGGDCPGKTELDPAILRRADVFVEYAPQTRIEGEIQQLEADFPVTEMWEVVDGRHPGRVAQDRITVFDSVGFALEDYSALRFVQHAVAGTDLFTDIHLVADPVDPKDLFALIHPVDPATAAARMMTSVQAPGAVVIIRPHHFGPNPATARDNMFQSTDRRPNRRGNCCRRLRGDHHVARSLHALGVKVLLFDDQSRTQPDSVFPNNWFSTHDDGRVALYPMYAPNRRTERRSDVIDHPAQNISRPRHRGLLGPGTARHLPRGHRRHGAGPPAPGRLRRPITAPGRGGVPTASAPISATNQ